MLVHGGTKETEACLREVVIEISETMKDEITQLAETSDKGKLDELMLGDWEDATKTLDYIAFFGVILNHPDLVKKLQGCF